MSSMAALHVVVMGVAGCGKSAVGERIAQGLGLPLIEGDEFHPASNIEKMRQGRPLDDQDRAGWLQRLGQEVTRHPGGAVLTCSALKRSYRDQLRSHVPGLRFAFLQLDEAAARERVPARFGEHQFPPALVANQFATLEPPHGEAAEMRLDATLPQGALKTQVLAWITSLDPVTETSP